MSSAVVLLTGLGLKHDRSILLLKKAVSHVINSRALTGEKPYINKAIQALLMHGYAIFIMIVRDVYCPALEGT